MHLRQSSVLMWLRMVIALIIGSGTLSMVLPATDVLAACASLCIFNYSGTGLSSGNLQYFTVAAGVTRPRRSNRRDLLRCQLQKREPSRRNRRAAHARSLLASAIGADTAKRASSRA